jgi:chitinase
MNDLDFLFDETTPAVYVPTAEDLQEYFDYLDSIGYDDGDDGEAAYDACRIVTGKPFKRVL